MAIVDVIQTREPDALSPRMTDRELDQWFKDWHAKRDRERERLRDEIVGVLSQGGNVREVCYGPNPVDWNLTDAPGRGFRTAERVAEHLVARNGSLTYNPYSCDLDEHYFSRANAAQAAIEAGFHQVKTSGGWLPLVDWQPYGEKNGHRSVRFIFDHARQAIREESTTAPSHSDSYLLLGHWPVC